MFILESTVCFFLLSIRDGFTKQFMRNWHWNEIIVFMAFAVSLSLFSFLSNEILFLSIHPPPSNNPLSYSIFNKPN